DLSAANERLTREVAERRRAEEALRASEELYRLHFEHAGDVICSLDSSMRIASISPSVTAVTGHAPQSVIGRRLDEAGLIHPDDLPRALANAARVLGGEPVTAEHRVCHVDGSEIIAEVSASPLATGAGVRGLVVVARDITQRRRAEEALQVQHDLAAALSATGDLAEAARCVLDATTKLAPIDCGGLYVLDPATSEFVVAAHRGVPEEFARAASRYAIDSPRGVAAMGGEPIYTVRSSTEFAMEDSTRREGIRSAVTLPIAHAGRVVACLHLASHTEDEIPLIRRLLLETIARNLGGALSRIQAEAALARSEAYNRTLIEAIPDTMYHVTRSGHYGAMVSDRGFPPVYPWVEHYQGRRVADLTPPEFAAKVEGLIAETLRTGQLQSFEYDVVHPDTGERFYREARYVVSGPDEVLCLARDITERRRAEEALRASEERYRAQLHFVQTLMDAIPNPVFYKGLDHRYIGCNQAFCDIARLPRDRIIGATVKDVNRTERAQRHREIDAALFANRQPILYELTGSTGRCFIYQKAPFYDHEGQLAGIVGTILDITDRKRMEEELRRSEAKNRALIEAVPDMKFRLDGEGRLVEFIPGVENELALEPKDFIGRRVTDVLPDPMASRFLAASQEALRTGRATMIEYHLHIPLPDGPVREFEARFARCGEGETFSVVRDITDRKRAERQLLEYQGQLRSMASQLSLIEERERRRLAGELHDRIGQALALARIKLGLLRKHVPAGVAGMDDVMALIEQTLQDTRSLTFQLSPPILYELGFEPAVEWLVEQIARQYAVCAEMEDDGQPKPLDDDVRVVLFQATRELLVNAARHSRAPRIRVRLSRDGGHIRIQVSDNGAGFDVAGASKGRGGFGLFSLRERLRHLGGSLQIESRPGQGTAVTLLAPLKG
ncbi:MAG: PAS domain S-box protein, partial [Phycisphaerae bacterium]|nr:PAS domain S-box protein [Phycisphaerae bacterium]